MKKKKWIIGVVLGFIGVLLVVCIGFVWASGIGPTIADMLQFQETVKNGAIAPDFELPALKGGSLRLSQFRGQPVLISFGATWCTDCKVELPILKQLQEKYPELVILSIDTREDIETVAGYVSYNEVSYPVVLDTNGSVADRYHIYAIPTVLVIDKSGVIQGRYVEVINQDTLDLALAAIGIKP